METANGKTSDDGKNDDTSKNGNGESGTESTKTTDLKVEKKDDKTVVIDGVSYVVQSHVDELVGTARTEGKNSGKTEAQKAADKAAAEARETALKEQGQYKDLYEAEMQKVADLQAQLSEKDAAILEGVRTGIAAKYGLTDLADRIKGDTAEDMEIDAKALAEHMGVKVPVSTQTGQGNKPKPSGTDADDSDDNSTDDDSPKGPQKNYAFQSPGEVKW